MELTAVINALECVKSHAVLRGRPIAVYTDSQYVQKGISSWIENWRRNGWKTAAKKPVKNRDLWEALVALRDTLDIRWHWVKGHAGHEHNERVDGLVQREIAKRS
jgi:ribonuclease HI